MGTRSLILASMLVAVAAALHAAQTPVTQAEWVAAADGLFRGTVESAVCYAPDAGREIWTATRLRVAEPMKGLLPDALWVTHPGGLLGERALVLPDIPDLPAGIDAVFGVMRRADSTLGVTGMAEPDARNLPVLRELAAACPEPPSDLRDAANGPAGEVPLGPLLPGSKSLSSRFPAPDRGEPIPYLVDLDALPAGISTNTALWAIEQALAAWSAASSTTFVREGIASFGTNAFTASLTACDDRIRIQLHDLYGHVTDPNALGLGGRVLTTSSAFPSGGTGGCVGTNRFDLSVAGAIVLKHTKSQFQNATNLAEVLCHELGHVLSLNHSSTRNPEPNTRLADAIMYYLFHGGGRGTRLGDWDEDTILLVHPTHNTPPYGYERAVRVVTKSGTPHAGPLGINQWEARPYDLQGGALTQAMVYATSLNGTFSLSGNTLTYAPAGYSSGAPLDPSPDSGAYYDLCYLVIGDGTHASPPVRFRVIELVEDSNGDKLPAAWQSLYWPSGGAGSGPNDDPDGDGSVNLDEWINGTHPKDGTSRLTITAFDGSALAFPARAYDLYALQAATSPTGVFAEAGNPSRPESSSGSRAVDTTDAPVRFFRLEHLP